jgi:acyl-CoA synthetase (AMP-forming)/AMP-acid ligase II
VKISTIYELLEYQAGQPTFSAAVLGPNRVPLSFEQLLAQVRAVVACLNNFGIHRNDKVAIVLPNGPEMAVAFLSVACGAIAAPLNPAYSAAEFEFYLSDLDARALIVQAGVASPAIEIARGRGIPIIEIVPRVHEPAGLFEFQGIRFVLGSAVDIAAEEDVGLVLHTSGTTSRPKMVPLTHQNLCASAQHISEALALAPSDCCLNIMPLFHIHGLVGAVLSSLISGASVVATPGFDAPRFFDWMAAFQPTWYTAVPTMHRAILARVARSGHPINRGRLRFIRSCSSALSPTLMAELESSLGVPVVEAYGMTEAAHQMACNPLPPAIRKSGSVGVATGTEIAIMEASGVRLLPVGEVGEVVVRGPNVMHGYTNQGAEQAFTDGWFRTGDLGRLDSDGYLFIEGRIKEIINRGGEKISPREVEEVLLQHPSVAQAVVFALADRALGQDVGAAVVLRDPSATERQLRQFVAARAAHFKVPSRIIALDALPVGPTGKPQRIGLAEKLGLMEQNAHALEPPGEDAAPRTPEEEFLAEVWCEVLNRPSVGIHQRFLDVGGDSLLAARTVARVCQRLDVDMSLLDFMDAPTIADQALMLVDKMQ